MKLKSDEELWEILGSVEKFNRFIEVVIEEAKQQVMFDVPALVVYHLKNEKLYSETLQRFFAANPELESYRPVVGEELNKVAAKDPGKPLEKMFEEAGVAAKRRVREYLIKNEGSIENAKAI